MHQRIEELAEQARKKPLGNSWTYRHSGEFEQKFAELIVRECADIADKAEPYKSNDLIKKHLGLEP